MDKPVGRNAKALLESCESGRIGLTANPGFGGTQARISRHLNRPAGTICGLRKVADPKI